MSEGESNAMECEHNLGERGNTGNNGTRKEEAASGLIVIRRN